MRGVTTAATPWLAFLRPFMLEDPSQFRSAPPPDLGSERYADDLNETKNYGAKDSALRTPEQTATAYFWNANNINQDVQAFRDVAIQHGMDLVDTARLLAMGELVAADAAIACWDSKYHYLFWRPYTAIRNADLDGNPATEPDPTWQPLFTPPYPDHPSGHLCLSSSSLHALQAFFGTDEVSFYVTSLRFPGEQRYFERFSEAISELIEARIWAGLHFRTADLQGAHLGEEVARYTRLHWFQPLP